MVAVHIANGHHFRGRMADKVLHPADALAAGADHTDGDFIGWRILPEQAGGQDHRRGDSGGSGFEETAAVGMSVEVHGFFWL